MASFVSSILMFASLVVPSAFNHANNLPRITTKKAVGAGDQTLRIMNVQDYIYVQDPEDPESLPDLVDQFKEYARKAGYQNVSVEYKTTDTPESMFNEVKLAPNNFDLICPSDYMIQKLISNDMIQPMLVDEDHIPNYMNYASKHIKERLDNIAAVKGTETCYLKDYAVGYMWGTLGLLFDPSYGGRDPELTIDDMQEWGALWNADYKGISSIKDSVRDTYAIGLLYTYEYDFEEKDGTVTEGFRTLMNKHEDGTYDDETFNEKFSDLFNRCDDETLSEVEKSLNSLKGNVFGMEVDSGKQDIITGKIGVNFAWSGDAVYSMEQALNEKGLELYYSIPNTGSNLWMDAWCMPKSSTRSAAQEELAYLFLDFLSDPEYTAQNMEYTGYTPFTAGNEILELTREWYDWRYDEEAEEQDYSLLTDEEVQENELQKIDLSYFFEGTLTDEDGNPLGEDETKENCIFYSDSYLPYAETDDEGNIINSEDSNIAVGMDFFCQFPDEYTLTRCAVMRDFGAQNDSVLKMWERFKSNALPVWATVVFIVEIVLALGLVGYFFIGNRIKHNLRKKRKEQTNKK